MPNLTEIYEHTDPNCRKIKFKTIFLNVRNAYASESAIIWLA